jgi:hypothetical protein
MYLNGAKMFVALFSKSFLIVVSKNLVIIYNTISFYMDGVQGTDVSDAIVIRFLKKKEHLQKYNAKFFSKGLLK